MRSNIKFNFAKAKTGAVATHETIQKDLLSLRMAKPNFFKIGSKNTLYHQEVNHFLANIELFQYTVDQEVEIDFSILKPSFFLSADLTKDSCLLSYRPAGKYKKQLSTGLNKMMLITFRPDWFIDKCQDLNEFKPLIRHFHNSGEKVLDLPPVGIAQSLFKTLKKIDETVTDFKINNQSYIFINSCINNYHNKLRGSTTTPHYQLQKAAEISLFVTENFNTEIVNDLPKLSRQFMVSERTMSRLAKIAFGIPLHEQVTKLRVHFALGELLITAKPIKDIAQLSGYKEPHYFSKVFKKYFGLSPKNIYRPYKTDVNG